MNLFLMIFFYCALGDHPEIQYESGNAIGGSYPCTCGVKLDSFKVLAATLGQRLKSLENRRERVCFINCKNIYNTPTKRLTICYNTILN